MKALYTAVATAIDGGRFGLAVELEVRGGAAVSA
jgi:hypothetical protein